MYVYIYKPFDAIASRGDKQNQKHGLIFFNISLALQLSIVSFLRFYLRTDDGWRVLIKHFRFPALRTRDINRSAIVDAL